MSDIKYVEVTTKWLRKVARQIVVEASKKSVSGKSGSAQGKPKIVSRTTKTRAVITATDFHFGRPALDSEIRVPIGGFPPPPGEPNWKFIKPEGKLVIVARTYSRFSGQLIKRRGFMSEALDDTLKGGTGQNNLDALSTRIAFTLAQKLAAKIVRDLNAQGINAQAA